MLISIRYDERDGMNCETLINPATEKVYAIAYVAPQHSMRSDSSGCYLPLAADMRQRQPSEALAPIPVMGQPGMVHACDSAEEAWRVLEVYDALRAD